MNLTAVQPFRLELAWLRAQAFRWIEQHEWFYGVINGQLVKVRQSQAGLEFRGSISEEKLEPWVRAYFRLDEDIGAVHAGLRGLDSTMSGLVERYGGMRLLRQDPWECLVAYICSQNNSVNRISGIVELLAGRYGTPMSLDSVRMSSFPSAQRLLDVDERELDELGLNRGRRILTVASSVVSGELDLNGLRDLSHAEARKRLISYNGIGPKIADCVCLFSLDKAEAFPVDRHIGGALREIYGKRYTPGANNRGLLQWARDYFGPQAGYAGQLLFYANFR